MTKYLQFLDKISPVLSATAGVTLLIGSALLSNLQMLQQAAATFTPEHLGRDEITLYEKRFEGLRRILSARGVIGYISNRQAEDIRFDVTTGEYYLTQYALAPLIVVYSQEPQLVVGNFRDPAAGVEAATSRHLVPLRDFGNGVMLFRHETP